MSPTSEKTLSNRTSSKKYYEKNKEKEREKARLHMVALRNNTRMAANPVKNRFPIKKLFEQNKESECEKARRHLALLRSKRMLEVRGANESPDLSYLDGEGDEHLKDIPALEIWRQTFKKDMTSFLVRLRYNEAIESDTTNYANEEEKKLARLDLHEALEVAALLAED